MINTLNNQVLVEELVVYEAAHGLVRLLNKNVPMNHAIPQNIMRLEEQFASLRDDTYRAQRRAKKFLKEGKTGNAGIYEVRAEEAHSRAMAVKKKLKTACTEALRLIG